MLKEIKDADFADHLFIKEKSIKFCKQQELKKAIKKVENIMEKGDFEHFMLKEIFEQPASIKASYRGRIKDDIVKLGGIYDWSQEILKKEYIY